MGPARLSKKVLFFSLHLQKNHFPLSGPPHSKSTSLSVTDTRVFLVFFCFVNLPVNSGKAARDRFTSTHTETHKGLLVELDLCAFVQQPCA